MDKAKKKSGVSGYYALIGLNAIALIVVVLLFSFSVITLLAFLISLTCISFLMFVSIYVALKNKKKKIKQINLNKEKIIITDQDIINLYGSAGIPIIRDEDGKIKNIFNLLGMEMTYDEYGNRLKTIYEMLGIVPRFTKDGKEIPTFMVIKNKVKGFIKPEKNTGVLTRILTEEQKEELLLRQMLEQKLKESEQNGDTKKVKVIQKVINQKKKEKAKETPKKTDGFIIIKPNTNMPKVSSPKLGVIKANGNFVFDIIDMLKSQNSISIKKQENVSISPSKEDKKDKEKDLGFSIQTDKSKDVSQQNPVSETVSAIPNDDKNFIYGRRLKFKKIDSSIKNDKSGTPVIERGQ